MIKIIKIILVSILTFFLILTIFYQFKFEFYVNGQKEKYGILKNRKRIKYKPAIISKTEFILNRNKGDIGIGARTIMYKELGLRTFSSSIIMDKYIADCYYEEVEKIQFICTDNKIYLEKNPHFNLNCLELEKM